MSNENNTKAAGGGLPVLFLGASAVAYFNMPEVSDSVTRLVASGAVGLGTSVATRVGSTVGGLSGLFAGAVIDKPYREGAKITGAIAGVVLGAGAGMYGGYNISKDVITDMMRDDSSAHTQVIPAEEMNSYNSGPEGIVTVDPQSGQTFRLALGN